MLNTPELAIRWPSPEERRVLAVDGAEELPECVGIVDGTHHVLRLKPALNPTVFYSYKSDYSIKSQIICDKNKRIIHLHTGVCGSVHDATVFKQTQVFKHPERYFSGQEYIAGDSAYPLKSFCVTPYKRNSTGMNAEDRKLFNKAFTKFRVRVENCIGETKNQFPSLQELPTHISCDADIHFISEWVAVCCMLHNFVMNYREYDDYKMYSPQDLADDDEDDQGAGDSIDIVDGERKREWLFNQMYE